MNKPKYKLGDIIYDRLCNSTELIVSIEPIYDGFKYETMVIEGRYERIHRRYNFIQSFIESTLDKWYVVIGNMLEGRRC